MDIYAPQISWAEQQPDMWWKHVCVASKRLLSENDIDAKQVKGIGISYQMHGLVVVDKTGTPLRNAIIWCDSRAVSIGEKAFSDLGVVKCMCH
jgi:xylulokinase